MEVAPRVNFSNIRVAVYCIFSRNAALFVPTVMTRRQERGNDWKGGYEGFFISFI
jgi:hypothetical protein